MMTAAIIEYVFGEMAKRASANLIRKFFDKGLLESTRNIYKYFFSANKSGEKLVGVWEGTFTQSIRQKKVDHSVLIKFTTKGRKDMAIGFGLYWKASLKKPREDQMTALLFTGAYHDDGFVRLDFRNCDKNVTQFGTILASISGDRNKIGGSRSGSGKAIWSAVSSSLRLVIGEISLKKDTTASPRRRVERFGAK